MNMKKAKNVKKKISPVAAFLVTFALVVGIGLIGMLGYLYVVKDDRAKTDGIHFKTEAEKENGDASKHITGALQWEAIPQKEIQSEEE